MKRLNNLLVILALASLPVAAWAVVPTKSQAQLHKDATDVVVAKIVNQKETQRKTELRVIGDIIADLKIESVKKGKLKPGQTIQAAYWVHIKTLQEFVGGQGYERQKTGQRVLVYLRKPKSAQNKKAKAKAKILYKVLYPNGFHKAPKPTTASQPTKAGKKP